MFEESPGPRCPGMVVQAHWCGRSARATFPTQATSPPKVDLPATDKRTGKVSPNRLDSVSLEHFFFKRERPLYRPAFSEGGAAKAAFVLRFILFVVFVFEERTWWIFSGNLLALRSAICSGDSLSRSLRQK